MDNSAQDNQATQAANELLERIFPSLRVAAAAPGKAATAEVVAPVIPIYRGLDECGRDILALGRKSLITAENRSTIRSGRYLIMLLDMPSHAEAAAVALRLSGAVERIELGKTPSGNGIILCDLKSEPAVPASRRVVFQGMCGDVQINWHDCRSSMGRSTGRCLLKCPVWKPTPGSGTRPSTPAALQITSSIAPRSGLAA